ncbi:hypothetical protein MYX06_02480, partial [Patescibacteria group bacterium AH-259-L05]|nr:hypothetical protein [Patescibacteria group bacterium AH-259-L05]
PLVISNNDFSMEQGTIGKLLTYYLDNPKFEKEVLRALQEFFDQTKLSSVDSFEFDEEAESRFNEWFVYDFRLKNKKTLLEDFYQRNPYNLSSVRLQAYKDLQDNEYALFEVLEVKQGQGLTVMNVKTEKEYWIQEYSATFQIQKGYLLVTRIGRVGDHIELIGGTPYVLPKEAKHPFLGRLVASKKLTPKIARDFFLEMEKVRNAPTDSLKEKLLDKGKCICDFCGKKGKLAATSYDRETGEPIVICYQCNLEILAERQGISVEEAEKRRKRTFGVRHLFEDIKVKEYFELKRKQNFDSLEEANKVLQRIVQAWNDLTIRQRKSFDTIDDKKLRKIYKKIKVDFSGL